MSYYVYGIVDPTEVDLAQAPSKEEQLGAVIYVGKGTGQRMDQHLKDAQYLLEYSPDSLSVAGRKLNRLAELLQVGAQPKAIKLMAGFEDEADAYRAEAFAIEAVNAIRMSKGRSLLTNAVKGHGIAMEDFESYMNRIDVEEIVLPLNAEEESILVKITCEDMTDWKNHEVSEPTFDCSRVSSRALNRVVFMEDGEQLENRRGWDRHNPWTVEDALKRAYRYWPIKPETVSGWIERPDTMPRFLLAGVEEAEGTVVRYVWEIDPEGMWEAYQADSGVRWGIPLGKNVKDHPYLNKVLRDGARPGNPQVLLNYSAGIRIARF